MLKIRQNKKNIFYILLGRAVAFLTIYIAIEILITKALLYVINNCITTIK